MKFKKKLFTIISTFLISLSLLPSALAFNLDAAQAYNQALDLYINGKTDDAIIQFKRSVSLDPEFTDAYYNLGSIYRYNNQLDLAEEAFQKVLSLKPNDSSVNYDLALIYIQKNDYKRAISFLNLVKTDSERYKDAQSKISLLNSELQVMQLTSKSSEGDNAVVTKTEISSDACKKNEFKKDNTLEVASNKNNRTSKDTKKENIKKVSSKRNSKMPKLSKEEANNISKSIASTSFQERKNIVEPETKINEKVNETSSPNKQSQQEFSENKNEKYWEKYSNNSTSKTSSSQNNASEEEIAINYMSIEDDSELTKLRLSPKSSLVNNISKQHTDNRRLSNSRSAIKTFATGFNGPTGIARDDYGNFYVANYSENKIYKITPDGNKSVYASSDDINGPLGLAIDNSGTLYVANYLSNSITRVSKDGETFTVATGLNKPYFLYLDNSGSLYVSEQDTNSVSVIKIK